jgi:hypothetical protein
MSDMGDLNEILCLVNEMDRKNKLVEYFNASLFLWKIWIQNNFGGRFGCIYIEMQVLKCRKIKKSDGDTYRCIPQFCTDKWMQKVFWGQWVVKMHKKFGKSMSRCIFADRDDWWMIFSFL